MILNYMNGNELGKDPVPELSEESCDVSNYVTRKYFTSC
jgi:hypothetical protein